MNNQAKKGVSSRADYRICWYQEDTDLKGGGGVGADGVVEKAESETEERGGMGGGSVSLAGH